MATMETIEINDIATGAITDGTQALQMTPTTFRSSIARSRLTSGWRRRSAARAGNCTLRPLSRNATWILCACASRNDTQCDKANSQVGRKFFSRGSMHIARVTVTISTPQTTFVLQDQSAKERKNA